MPAVLEVMMILGKREANATDAHWWEKLKKTWFPRQGDIPAIFLLFHMRPGRTGDHERALEMNTLNQIPVRIAGSTNRAIAENTSVVNDLARGRPATLLFIREGQRAKQTYDVDTTEGFDGSLHNLVTVLDRVVVSHSLSTGSLDLSHDFVRGST